MWSTCKDAPQAGKHNFPLHNEDEERLPHTLRWFHGSQSVPLHVAGLKFLDVMTDRHINVYNSIRYQVTIQGGCHSSRMGGLNSGKVK